MRARGVAVPPVRPQIVVFVVLLTLIILLLGFRFIPEQQQTVASSRVPNNERLQQRNRVYITEYGAVGDGVHLDTAAIQAAIDACTAMGGCKVVFPPGKYKTGTIILKDNVILHLNKAAVIVGSEDISQYVNIGVFVDGIGAERGNCLICALKARNIGIEGSGTIDGNGDRFTPGQENSFERWSWDRRPFLLRFARCNGVHIHDVHLTNPAAWTCNFFESENIRVSGVDINTIGGANRDGIDIDASQNVIVENSHIRTGDDALCFKSTSNIPVRNVYVSNCKLSSDWGAIKFGTESVGGFEDILIRNVLIYDTRGGGVKLFSVDGGIVRNITIENVVMRSVTIGLFFRLGSRLRTFHSSMQFVPKQVGSFHDVTIRNLSASLTYGYRLAGDWIDETRDRMTPMLLLASGLPGRALSGIRLADITVNHPGGAEGYVADDIYPPLERIPEEPQAYPELYMFGKHVPSCGVFIRHAENFVMENVRLNYQRPEIRPAIILDDVRRAQLQSLAMQTTEHHGPVSSLAAPIRLHNAHSVEISQLKAHLDGHNLPAVRVEGAGSSNVVWYDCTDAEKMEGFDTPSEVMRCGK